MIVAVDTGGTKTLVAVFDTEGQVVAKEKFPTPPDISDYITQLSRAVDNLVNGATITCLSVALPGTIVDGVMVWAGNLSWENVDIKALLASRYNCPIVVENDANLAGLAEARALAEAPTVCLYVTISTGVGTGLIVDSQIDPRFSTTEGGQIVLEHNGELKRWESFASGKAIHAKYGKLASEITDDNAWKEIGHNIAYGLLATCALIRPSIVVIGGGVGTHFDKFRAPMLELMVETSKDKYIPLVTKAAHPEEAVIYGCYYYALDVAAA
jgi:predicted NBD/HSP70 family sugar kinase